MCVGSLAGVIYLRYAVLTSSNKSEKAVHCCDPALSVLVMLVSRNVFHLVSALQPFAFIDILFWLIRSLVDPSLAVFIVCGPLQLVAYLLPSSAPHIRRKNPCFEQHRSQTLPYTTLDQIHLLCKTVSFSCQSVPLQN